MDINHALVEEKRPPMYTAMKYWGKKPHNIWNEYISTYTDNNGIILDPFSGSALAAFEAVKAGRKAYAFDINPLTSFIIETYSTNLNIDAFKKNVYRIFDEIVSTKEYQNIYTIKCEKCGFAHAVIQHSKWENESIYEYGINCPSCGQRFLSHDVKAVEQINNNAQSIIFDSWIPDENFYQSPSFSSTFIANIGGNNFNNIWTRRNLYVLSKIFDKILSIKDHDIKFQLLFGFIQSVHLSSKMCVPRREGSNRAFSTSWGRSAYLCSKRQMEMNPLLLFKNNCIGKQSVESALNSVKSHLGKIPFSVDICSKNKQDYDKADIIYGTVNIHNISAYLKQNSIDFIITDPPYGGLVQYADLSYIWLIWLQHFDPKFAPNRNDEITIKEGIKSVEDFNKEFTNGIKELYNVLKSDSKIIFTFHNQDLAVWKAFLTAISEAGFLIENVIHQQNKRTGESNVTDPYGMSASDFYIRCIKGNFLEIKNSNLPNFDEFVINEVQSIITERGEPTPYQIIFNNLLSAISMAGFNILGFDSDIKKLLSLHIGKEFLMTENNEKKGGNLWWLFNMDLKNTQSLSNKVENHIVEYLNENGPSSFENITLSVFKNFTKRMTPSIKKIEEILNKIAYEEKSLWRLNDGKDRRKV